MIRYYDTNKPTTAENLRGGKGKAEVLHFLGPEETGGKCGLFNLISLLPGSSIGIHPHTEDGEAYLVVEGELVFTENGEEHLLHPGDISYTSFGDTHGMENRSENNAKLLAVVFK